MNIFSCTAPGKSINAKTTLSNLVGSGIFELTSKDLCTLLLYGNEQFDTVTNRVIIEATVQFIQRSKRFERN